MSRLVAPNGRIVIFAWGNSFPSSYLKFSPDWITDYFALNQWADCKTYSFQFDHKDDVAEITAWYFDPYEFHHGQVGYTSSHITTWCPSQTMCIAERGPGATIYQTAVQKHYRGSDTDSYRTSILRFRDSARPLFQSPFCTRAFKENSIGKFGSMRQVAAWPPLHYSGD